MGFQLKMGTALDERLGSVDRIVDPERGEVGDPLRDIQPTLDCVLCLNSLLFHGSPQEKPRLLIEAAVFLALGDPRC